MTMTPDPGVLDSLIRERQAELRTLRARRSLPADIAWRVRLGHALIAAGSALSGERVEAPARPSALRHAS